ncbi:MAG: 5-oxoprolinase subunit PxpB [Treponema sp.]
MTCNRNQAEIKKKVNAVKIVQAGENAISIQFEQKISPALNSVISRLCFFLDAERFADRFFIQETVPSYCAILVVLKTKRRLRLLKKEIYKKLFLIFSSDKTSQEENQTVHKIPVCYDDEFSPDIKNVCAHTGLSKEEVIARHAQKEYLVYMLGFLPGFAYLGGMDTKLETPRLKTPRTKIPAGSVAIGGSQTGIYPAESPGGWQIIGKTPVKTFDIQRNPAVFFKAGDKIKFEPVSKEEFFLIQEKESKAENACEKKERFTCTGGIKILNPGLCTTVQDAGRKGFLKSGITENGAMDKISFETANAILGNAENTAVLETTIFGPEIYFFTPADFCITGADIHPELNCKPCGMYRKIHAEAGSVLKTGFASDGLRSYVAFKGGILVKKFFKSSSTDLKCKYGGFEGRRLCAGDQLALGDNFCDASCDKNSARRLKNQLKRKLKILLKNKTELPVKSPLTLRVVKSSQFAFFSREDVKTFCSTEYEITPESDRMGIRLKGKKLACSSTDIISDGIPFGAVQITSEGLPVIMAQDRQTCGGYAKIACVVKKDMNILAQCKSGTKIKFKFTD